MPEKEKTILIHKVIIFTAYKYDEQIQKMTNIPYFSHLAEVMQTLTKNDCSENVIIAGILHYVKDTRRFL
jgi:(p)ppGpp synthase/HD superfamily hydrolase